MPLQVLVLSAQVEPPLFVEAKGRKIVLGRGADATVRLPDPTVSKQHAVLRKRGDSYLLSDEASTNGTAILTATGDTIWLDQESSTLVGNGARLRLGQVVLELRTDGSAEGLPSEDLALDLVTASFATLGLPLEADALTSALDELTDSEDEPMSVPAHREPDQAPRLDDAGVVSEMRDRSVADWAIAFLALAMVGFGAGALSWLLR